MHSEDELRIQRWIDSELGPEESEAVRREIEARPDLARQVEELRELRSLLRVSRVEAPAGFRDAVLARTFDSPFRTETWPRVLPMVRRLLAAAVLLVVVAMGSAEVGAVARPAVLFHPDDPAGVTPLRGALGELGRTALLSPRPEAVERLLRRFTEEASRGPHRAPTQREIR